MHRDVVRTVPEGFDNLGTSPRCGVQGLYMPNRALSVQAHPEFDHFIMTRILEKRCLDGVFDDVMYKAGRAGAMLEHDGVLVSVAILGSLLQAAKMV